MSWLLSLYYGLRQVFRAAIKIHRTHLYLCYRFVFIWFGVAVMNPSPVTALVERGSKEKKMITHCGRGKGRHVTKASFKSSGGDLARKRKIILNPICKQKLPFIVAKWRFMFCCVWDHAVQRNAWKGFGVWHRFLLRTPLSNQAKHIQIATGCFVTLQAKCCNII